jgi:phage regulator Rha-like protein
MQEHQIIEIVQTKIYAIRNQKVMLDSDIADIYGVETKRINEAVRNNPEKFPTDFVFELNEEEQEFLRSKISTLKTGRGKHRKYAIKAFTEQGIYMLATILKSPVATQVTVAIMRAFVAMRHFSLTYGQIVEKLAHLNGKVTEHDDVLEKIIQALSELIQKSQTEETKKIGFL